MDSKDYRASKRLPKQEEIKPYKPNSGQALLLQDFVRAREEQQVLLPEETIPFPPKFDEYDNPHYGIETEQEYNEFVKTQRDERQLKLLFGKDWDGAYGNS